MYTSPMINFRCFLMRLRRSLTLLLTAASTGVLAAEQAYPDIPAYEAYKSPYHYSTSPLKNFYISGKIGAGFQNLSSIENISPPINSSMSVPPVTSSSASGSVTQWGVGIGYMFQPTGIFSRFEVEYMNRGSISYDANPLLEYPSFITPPPPSSISSTIHNQTILGKIYYDMQLSDVIFPYIQIGGGYSWSKTEGTGSIENDPFSGSTITNFSNTKGSFAFDAGLGLRFKAGSHFLVDLGYEFDYLGTDLDFTLQTDLPDHPVQIQSGTFYSNSINLALTYQF